MTITHTSFKTKCTETRVIKKHKKVLSREKYCYTKENLQRES